MKAPPFFRRTNLFFLFALISAFTLVACSPTKPSAPDISEITATPPPAPTLTPTTEALEASVVIGLSRDLPADFLGANASSQNPGVQPETQQVFKNLEIHHVRYPGGGTANYWDWQLGWIDQDLKEDDMIWWMMGMQSSSDRFTLEDLAVLYEQTGVQPIFVLNVITRDLADQLERLHYAASLGLPIRKIELGNELYLDIEMMVIEHYPAVEDYAADANRWAAAIKAEFPEAEIAVTGAAHPHAPRGRSAGWNKNLLPLLSADIDAVAEHIYIDSGLGPKTETSGNAWAEDIFQQAQYNELQTPAGIEKMLSRPFQAWYDFDRFSPLAEDREIWMTEFNLFDWTGPARGTWANGLLVAGFIHNFLEDERVTLATYHSFGGGPLFTTYFPSEDFWDGLTVTEVDVTPFEFTASGVILNLFGETMASMEVAAALNFDPNPEIELTLTEPYPALWGWQFSNAASTRSLIVNYAATPVSLNLEALNATGQPYRQYDAPPASHIVGWEDVNTQAGTTENTLLLPPFSITLIGE